MPEKGRFYYWDSNIFLAYLNNEPGRANIIEDLWKEIEKEKHDRIVTSTATSVEIFFTAHEKKQGKLDPLIESTIQSLFNNQAVVYPVETSLVIAEISRKLMRFAMSKAYALKTFDALELATAKWVHDKVHSIEEIHTYDDKLKKFEAFLDIKIANPHVIQPSLTSQLPKKEEIEEK